MKIYFIHNNDGSKSWGVDYRNPVTGKRIREIIGNNKKQAEDVLAKIRGEIVLHKTYGEKEYFENINKAVKDIKFDDMVKIYLEFAYTAKRSADRDKRSLKNLGNHMLPPNGKVRFGDKYLSEITEKIIEDYKGERLKQVKSVTKDSVKKKYIKPATVNREIACLKHMLNLAVQWKYTNYNPAKNVKLFKEDNSRTRYLDKDQIDKLISACEELKKATYLKPVIIIAINTGMRKSEILHLQWKDIDFKQGLLYIRTSKNGEGGYIPINSTVQNTLQNFMPQKGNTDKAVLEEYIFKSYDGKPFKDIRTAFIEALKLAGIEGIVFHNLRHTFASHLVMNGVDLTTVKELLRHKTIAMTMRYAHLSPEHKKAAIEGLYKKKDGRNLADSEN